MNNLKKLGISWSMVAFDRLQVLELAINNTIDLNGVIYECGCNKGGAGLYMIGCLQEQQKQKTIRFFDTFTGIPNSSIFDKHPIGSFKENVNIDLLRQELKPYNFAYIHEGVMPKSFEGLENDIISVAHIDVDNYQSVKDCLEFIYPRMQSNGYIIIDDYNCPDCPGAKKATLEFFNNKPEHQEIYALNSSQVVYKKK